MAPDKQFETSSNYGIKYTCLWVLGGPGYKSRSANLPSRIQTMQREVLYLTGHANGKLIQSLITQG